MKNVKIKGTTTTIAEIKIPGTDELIEISKTQLDTGRGLLATTFGKYSLKMYCQLRYSVYVISGIAMKIIKNSNQHISILQCQKVNIFIPYQVINKYLLG